jgi:hypothetical protein
MADDRDVWPAGPDSHQSYATSRLLPNTFSILSRSEAHRIPALNTCDSPASRLAGAAGKMRSTT